MRQVSRWLFAAALGAAGCSAEGGELDGMAGFGGASGSGNNGSGSGNVSGGAGNGGGSLGDDLKPSIGGAPGTGMVCSRKQIDSKRLPADVVVVLDRSGSMRQSASRGEGSKWTQTTAALSQVLQKTQNDINWSLKLYPMPVGTGCGVPPSVEIAPSPAKAADIVDTYTRNASREGTGGTPTQGAVRAATAFLKASMSANPKYLLLATDGLPNCKDGRGREDWDFDGAVGAIADAAKENIPTFVIGIGLGDDARMTLNRMAEAGLRPRNDPMTKYYPVADQTELVTALGAITGQVSTCTFTLDQVPESPDLVGVKFEGTPVPRNAMNGWEFGAGMRTIELRGSFCDKVTAAPAMSKPVEVTVYCPGEPVP